NLCSAQLTDSLSDLQDIISPMEVKHGNNIVLNAKLFERIKAVYDSRKESGLDAEQIRLVEKTYDRFVSSGANLSPEQKDQLRAINEKTSDLSLKFGNNLLKEMSEFVLVVDNKADLEGLSANLIDAAASKAAQRGKEGVWMFTLDKPSMIPFLQSSPKRELREKLYKGYLNRCNYGDSTDNKAVINELVNLRTQRANLLGFDSHAAAVLDRNMAKTPENVYALLDQLWTPAIKRASDEMAEMIEIKKAETGDASFESWDWWYYAEKLRAKKYNLDEKMLAPYFSLETTREGVFTVCNNLYGLTFKPIENAPTYNSECQTYEVFDADGSSLGALIMDFFPREGKGVGAWCSSFRSQRYENGKRVAPISTIVCNFTRPVGDAPALLNLDEVETFFHEFGHALHGLLSNVKYSGLKGVTRDFVELPSQIMENWAMDPQVLKMYAKNYKTGEVIPDTLVEKITNSALFNQGFLTVEYLGASLLDMDFHTIKNCGELDVAAFEEKSLSGRGNLAQIAPRYRSTYFKHIFSGGYSAGYYAYIWAEVLDADAYNAFTESGNIFNKEIATKFRKNILEVGGTLDEMELYKNFRGA
ncbi:MAG: M3 family metallopeptidase, partial [Rikenellaceae bacterium]